MTPEPPKFPRRARRVLGLINVLAGLANTGFWTGLVLLRGGSSFGGTGIYVKVLFLLLLCGSAYFGLVAGIGLLLDRFWGGKALIAAVILGVVPAVFFLFKGSFLFLSVIAVTAPSVGFLRLPAFWRETDGLTLQEAGVLVGGALGAAGILYSAHYVL